jgi:hypothetical protein
MTSELNMNVSREQLEIALEKHYDRIEGLVVKSHDGRMGSMSDLFRDLSRRLNERMDAQDLKIQGIEDALKPMLDGISAGKLSYWFLFKAIGLISAIVGMIIMIKQMLK